MLGAREELVLCTELQISKSARLLLVLWIQVYELFAQFDAEIRRNPFGDVYCDRGLAFLESVAGKNRAPAKPCPAAENGSATNDIKTAAL